MFTRSVLLTSTLFASVSSIALAQGGPPTYAPPIMFPAPAPVVPPPVPGTPPTIFVTGDIDGDGSTDLVHLNTTPAPDVIITQLGVAGGFIPGPTTTLLGYPVVTSIALGDMNMDGMLDIAVLSPVAGGMFRQIGVGGGAFAAGPFTAVPLAGGTLLSMAITDVTADAFPDLLFLRDGPGGAAGIDSIQIMVGFPAFVLIPGPVVMIGPGASSFKPADLDLNGAQDLVTLQTVPVNAFYIHAQVAPATFMPGPMPIVPLPAGVSTTTFEACDLDSDADLDLVTLRPGVATIFSLLQGLPGFFGPALPSATPPALAANFVITDVNGDCVLDASYLSVAPIAVFDHLGTGFGPFAPILIFPMPGVSFWQVAADFDSDGTQDIATLNSTAGFGDGTWLLTNVQPDPPSVVPYGTGTPGRLGGQGMLTNGMPIVGTPGFGFTSTNCPPNALGLLFITNSLDLPGTALFGTGALFHVDFILATEIYVFDIRSGPNGSAGVVTGIPADPLLVGLPYFAMSLWIWDTATAWEFPPVGASTTAGVMLTILP